MTNRVLASAAVTAVLLGIVVLLAVFLMANSGSAAPNAPITAQNPLAGTSNTATSQGPPLSDEYVTVRTQDFGVWSYSATCSAIDPLHASVNYRHDTVADLKAYAEANKVLLPRVVKLGGIAEVAVSFAYPVSVKWFRSWARGNHFQVDSSQLLGGYSISATADDPLPQERLGSAPHNPVEDELGSVFGTYGTIDASHLAQLWAEPRIFLVDVTPAWVRYDLAHAGITEPLRDRIQVALPYGWMERMGLYNFTDLSIPSPPSTIEPLMLSPAPDEP